MFSVVSNTINTSQKLNKDLDKVSLLVNKWKMLINPDPSKQAQEVIFSRKITKSISPTFFLQINLNSKAIISFQSDTSKT